MLYKAFRVISSKCLLKVYTMRKRRTTIYVDEAVWEKFIKYLIDKHGKTHGGVISEEIESAILLLVKK